MKSDSSPKEAKIHRENLGIVIMRFNTIKEGEEAVIFDINGQGRHIVGPERVFLFRKRLERLKHVSASQYQYLVMKDKQGMVSHKRGPCHMFHNPLEYDYIHVEEATKIDANHMIVVYRRVKNSVNRSIIEGPAIFFPEADEWLHKFEWHGARAEDKARMIPGYWKFTQLTAIPDQFYYNVRDVRTTDDIIITVKLMIFYQLNDVVTMLDTSHDPIADMINAVCADVIAYVGRRTYDQFLEDTENLSYMNTFPQLTQRGERMGLSIQKVVYRGYHATPELQNMQTLAIEARTRLRLDNEMEDQREKLVDYKLKKEQERTKKRQAMENSKLEHSQKLEKLKQTHDLELKEAQHTHQLLLEQMDSEAKLAALVDEQTVKATTLSELSKLGVDLTQYLVSEQNCVINEDIQLVKS